MNSYAAVKQCEFCAMYGECLSEECPKYWQRTSGKLEIACEAAWEADVRLRNRIDVLETQLAECQSIIKSLREALGE
jgi:hypothetical protein